MTKEQLEIVKALKTIKQECACTYDCYMCPYEKLYVLTKRQINGILLHLHINYHREVIRMGINALTARKLAEKHRREQIRQVMAKTITKPVRWVLCWGKMDYRTGKWEWKNEHSFENRTAALANKNSFLRYPVDEQNACYVVRRYEHGHQNTAEAMEGIR